MFHKLAEFIFTMIILLFLSAIILGVLIVASIVHELGVLNIGYEGQVAVIIMATILFVLIMKVIIDRIKDFSRYI